MSDTPIFDQTPDSVNQSKVDEAFAAGHAAGYDSATAAAMRREPVVIDSTPNVKITNPNIRRTITFVATLVGAVLGTLILVDKASPVFDISDWTDPISAGYLYLTGFYGITVTLPNIPVKK